MAALKWPCGCGMLWSRGGHWYLPKYVSSLGCSKALNRLTLVQDRLYSETDVTCSDREVPRKKRDQFTVLRALASTVEHVPNRPDYRFYDDFVLNPRSLIRQKEILLAIDSGSKAAEYVMEKYPHLFPMRDPVPAWPKPETTEVPEGTEVAIDSLRLLMKNDENIMKVIEWYKKLDYIGDIPLDVHNDMLEFVSFYAVPGESVDNNDGEGVVKEVYDDNKASVLEWKEGNFAENLFHKLKTNANARTYEVYILGLLKHGKTSEAFQIYHELNGKNLCGSLYMYNTLLYHVYEVLDDAEERLNLAWDIVASIRRSNTKPDVVTFNSLMAVALEREEDSSMLCQQLFREMKSLNISPSPGSYYFLLSAEKNSLYRVFILEDTLKDMKSGVVRFELKHPSDVMFFDFAMDVCRFKRNAELARELLDFVLKSDLTHLVGKQLTKNAFFGNYICTCARESSDVDDVFKEYHRLVPKFFTARDWVLRHIFYCMRNNKDPKHVPALYSHMMSLRVPFTEKVVEALFSAMQHNVPKERCEEYLRVIKDAEKWMGIFQIEKTTETMSVAIQILCLCGHYAEAMERMEECKTLNIIPNVDAIHSVYKLTKEERNQEDALNLLKTMANDTTWN